MNPERMWLDKDGKAFPDHQGFDDPSYAADLTLYVRGDLTDGIDGLTADLRSAVTIAWKYGAKDWVRMNYPRLAASLDKHTDREPDRE